MIAGNPTSTLEKPKNYLQFSELGALRDELTKQTEDAEKRSVLEKTIDEALKSGEKSGIIEFTREEWETLTKAERFASVGAVKELLKQKIIQRREVTEEAKVEKKGLIAKIEDKVKDEKDKLVEAGKQKVEDVKMSIEQKIKDKLSPLEKLKFGWNTFIFSMKIGFYGIFAKMGFGWAKNALQGIEKEKLEKLSQYARDKGITLPGGLNNSETSEMKNTETGTKNTETVSENSHAPLAILGSLVGVGVLGKMLPGKLGTALAVSQNPKIAPYYTALSVAKFSGKILSIPYEAMKFVGKMGVLGIVGFAGYKLYKHLSENPEDMKTAGEKPDKAWWSQIIDKVWSKDPDQTNAAREKKYLLSCVTGEKKIETVTEDEHPEGMEAMGDKLEKVTEKTSEPILEIVNKLREFPNAAGVLGVTIGTKIGLRNIVSFTKMSGEIAINLAKAAFFGMPITAVLGLIGYLGWKRFASESVPKDPKEFEDFIAAHAGEIDAYCQEEGLKGVDGRSVIKEDQLRHIASYISAPEKISEAMNKALGKVSNAILFIGKNVIGESPEKVEKEKNLLGIHTMFRRIEADGKGDPKYKNLLETLATLTNTVANIDLDKQTLSLKSVTKLDVKNLEKACAGTDILIESHHGYILWSHAEKNGKDVTYLSVPQRICIDPEVTDPAKRHDLAKEFQIDTEVTGMNYLGSLGESMLNDVQSLAFALTIAIEGDNKVEAEGILQMLFDRGCNIVGLGANVFLDGAKQGLIELPVNTIRMLMGFAGAKNWGITIQEFGAQYANGIIPMCIFSKIVGGLSPISHHADILKRVTSKIPVLGRPLDFVVRSAVRPLTATYDVLRYGTKRITSPLRILSDARMRIRYVSTSLLNAIPGSSVSNSLQIVEGLKARYLVDHMDSILRSGKSIGHNKEILKESLEHLLGHGDLMTKNGPLTIDEILHRVESKNNIKEIVEALDDHLKNIRLEFFKNSPRMRAIANALMKIPNATKNGIENVVNHLAANPEGWGKTLTAVGGATIFAYMAYDIANSNTPRETVTNYATGMALYYGGRAAGGLIGMKFGKGPLGMAIGGIAGLATCFIPGPMQWLESSVQKKADEMIAAGAFNTAVWNEGKEALSMSNWFLANRSLMSSKLGRKIFEQISKKTGIEAVTKFAARKTGLEFLAKKIGKAISGTMIEGFIKKLGVKVGWAVAEGGARAGAVSLIPVAGWIVDVGLLAWTAKDVYDITTMISKARTMQDKQASQMEKPVKDVTIDRKGEELIAELVLVHEGKKYFTLTDEEKIEMKMKYFEQTARCNITIEREDGSRETYGYAAGSPTYAKIEDKDGSVIELTKEDLNHAETWEIPENYQPEKIPYAALPQSQLEFYYKLQAQKLRTATAWQALDTRVESGTRITVSREDFQQDTITIDRQSDNSWTLRADKHKLILPGKYDFHGALALAGLMLYSIHFLVKEVHENKDDDWKSEDGTLTPFSLDKDSINYSKDDAMDKDFMKKWLSFYENKLKVSPENIKNALNIYFGSMAKELDLIGD